MAKKGRRIVQTASLLLLHSSWGPELKWLCNPVLSCHSCVLAWFACPIGVLVHYSGYHLIPFLALGSFLIVGALFGRILCGWACPFGFLQELLYKIPTPKFRLPGWAWYLKYVVLVLMVFLFPFFLGEETALSFCRVCPASALQVTLPRLVGGGTVDLMTAVKLGVLVGTVGLVIFFQRGFCKTMCPIGAALAPLNLLSLWFIRIPKSDCIQCDKCDDVCPTNVVPSTRISERVPANRAADCVVCHDCQEVCPGRTLDARARAQTQQV